MRIKLLRGVACGALLTVAQTAPAAGPLAEDAKAFGTREQVRTMSLSADGSKVAMLVSAAGSTTVLQVADLTTGGIASLTNTDGRPESLR